MPRRTDRLDFRLTPSARRLIERAAELSGVPLTAFAVQVLVERAQEVVETETQRRLSERDWKRFVSMLDRETVTPALAKAVRRSRAG